jgi:glycosyltransferase involved in cell wall biosynthesis
MASVVTVAIPVLNGRPLLDDVLTAVAGQRLDRELEVVVCDSGSRDGSLQLAQRLADRVIRIPGAEFSHGDTRNLLMESSGGDHVAFLTQDAVPASDTWLAGLLGAFDLAENVGLAFGPYRPRPDASVSVARELAAWFGSLSAGDGPRIDALGSFERSASPRDFLGRRGFFTDANGCIARPAWERVRFRRVSYAEDHLLAQDMLRAGFAKVYAPAAAVIHSHDYSPTDWLRRSFDEGRAMRDVYDWVEPASPTVLGRNLWGRVAGDWRWARDHGSNARPGLALLAESALHHGARTAGLLLGSRADRLPAALVRELSLERRER